MKRHAKHGGEGVKMEKPEGGLFRQNGRRRTYGLILEGCGKKTKIRVSGEGISVNFVVDVEYSLARRYVEENFVGRYVEGVGLRAFADLAGLCVWADACGEIWPLVHEILKQEEEKLPERGSYGFSNDTAGNV